MTKHVHYDLDAIKQQMVAAQDQLFQTALAACRDDTDRQWMTVQHRLWQASLPIILAIFTEWNEATDSQMIAKGVAMITGNVCGFFAQNADPLAQLRMFNELPEMINKAMDASQADYHTGLVAHAMQGSRA